MANNFGQIVAGYIFNDEMKEKLIKRMNENVDIPLSLKRLKLRFLTQYGIASRM